MRRSLTLGQRIALGAALLIFFVLFTSGLGLWYARASARNVSLTQDSLRQVSRLARMEATWGRVAATIDSILLTRQADPAAEQLESDLARFDEQLAQIEAQKPGIAPQKSAENERILINMRVFADDLTQVSSQILIHARQRNWAQAQVLRHTELATLRRRFDEQLSVLVRNTHDEVDAMVAASARRQRAMASTLTVALILAVVVGAALTIVSVRSITTPINQLSARVRRVTEGDFSYLPPLDRADEIGTLSEAFSIMTEWLQESYQVLEERVTERTHDLELAAEVGRHLGHVRELDELLPEAVELIRSRFDLYYAQVFLASDDGRSLLLEAGTGDVGAELRRRGFQLPIDRNSLNGTAVLERHPLVISDTARSGRFRPNPLLPETRSEIAMPLMSGEQVVGVLDLQSSRRYGLTEDNLPAFQVLAGQLAISIENALLLHEARGARAALQGQARRLVGQQWQRFLDAIRRSERVAYAYEGGSVIRDDRSEAESASGDDTKITSIRLNEQPIGSIRLESEPAADWSLDELEMVDDVARGVAQKIENLRLLAESERYRDEAEAAVRRLTREGWESFHGSGQAEKESYLYDGQRVQSLDDMDDDFDLAQPLVVRGEEVGELLVSYSALEEGGEAASLISAVAARLSAHLENLRLTQQTESALVDVRRRSRELELLNRVVTRIASTLELRQSLQVVVDELVQATSADQARIGLLDEGRSALTIVAECFDEARSPSALHLRIPIEGNELTQRVLETRDPVVVHNAQSHPLAQPIRDMLREQGIQHMVIMPIMAGNEVIGTVGIDILEESITFNDAQMRLAETIVFQAATAIQNARLFDQVQNALEETRSLYRASADLNAARTYEDVLQVLRGHADVLQESSTVSLTLFDVPWSDSTQPKFLQVMAYWTSQRRRRAKLRYSLAEYPALSIMKADRPALIEDVAADSSLDEQSRRALLSGFGARSVLALPLLVGGQWIGHVIVMYPEAQRFSFERLQNVRNLVGQAAVAVQSINLLEETSRLLESEQRQRRISDTLVRATGRMLGVMEESDIRRIVVDEIRGLVGPDLISLYTWQEEEILRLEIREGADKGRLPGTHDSGEVISPEQRPDLWRVMQDDKSVLVERQGRNGRLLQQYLVPWQVGDRVGGVIELYATDRDASLAQEDQASIEGVVRQAAIRLQSARLFREAELRAEELAVLNEMSQALTALLDIPAVLETVFRFTTRLMDTSNFYVALHHPQEEKISFPIFIQDGERAEWPERTFSDGLTERVIRDGKPLLISRAVKKALTELGVQAMGDGAQSWLGVPMLLGEEVLGVLTVQSEEVAGAYDEHDQELLSAVAGAAAIALQNARLFEETQMRAAETEALYRASRRINTAEDYDEILAALHRHTILGREASALSLNYFDQPWTEGNQPEWIDVLSRWSKLRADPFGSRYNLRRFSAAPNVLKQNRPVLIVDVANDSRLDEGSRSLFHERLGATSTLFVPLVVGGQWLGFVNALYERPVRFPESELRRLMALAGQAATSIHSIRLLEQARSRAEREKVIRQITAQVRSATDVDVIMKTAVREVGRALRRDTFVVLGDQGADEEAKQPAGKESG